MWIRGWPWGFEARGWEGAVEPQMSPLKLGPEIPPHLNRRVTDLNVGFCAPFGCLDCRDGAEAPPGMGMLSWLLEARQQMCAHFSHSRAHLTCNFFLTSLVTL